MHTLPPSVFLSSLSSVSCSSSSSSSFSSSTCPFTLTCPLSSPPRAPRNSIKKITIRNSNDSCRPAPSLFSLIEREIFTKKIKQGKNYWDPILPVFSSSRRATATFYEITDRKRAISLNALGVLSSNGPLSLPDATTLDVDGRRVVPNFFPCADSRSRERSFDESPSISSLRFFSSRVRPRYYFHERVDLIPIRIESFVCSRRMTKRHSRYPPP